MRTCVLALGLLTMASCQLGNDALTEQKFCEQYAQYECAGVAIVCGATPEACQTVRLAACKDRAAASKTGGRTYNPANTDSCLTKVRDGYKNGAVPIATLEAITQACERVFQGMAHANEACKVDYDCDGNLICDKGRCGAPRMVASGAGCANIGEFCPPAEYCTNASGLYMCTKAQAKGAACSATQPCDPAFRCATTCVDKVPAGAACTSDDECTTRFCNPFVKPGQTRTCIPGLNFAVGSASCDAYAPTPGVPAASPDAGASD